MFNKTNTKPKIFNEERLFSYGIWLLSKRDYSINQIREKFTKYQPDKEVSEKVLQKIISLNYLDDRRFSKNFIQNHSHKEGLKKIELKLIQKGVEKQILQEIVQEFLSSQESPKETSQQNILKLLEKKFKTFNSEQYNKYMSFLAYRGFSFEDIQKSIKLFKEQSSES